MIDKSESEAPEASLMSTTAPSHVFSHVSSWQWSAEIPESPAGTGLTDSSRRNSYEKQINGFWNDKGVAETGRRRDLNALHSSGDYGSTRSDDLGLSPRPAPPASSVNQMRLILER
jgi:hypothetical protein